MRLKTTLLAAAVLTLVPRSWLLVSAALMAAGAACFARAAEILLRRSDPNTRRENTK